ncbi:MAG: type II secretion system protein GspM [Casimicrobiaceae bacterium]
MIAAAAHRHAPGLARWWDGASAREHTLVIVAALAVALAVAWIGMVQPMLVDIARLQRDNPRSYAILAAAQAQAADMAALAGATRPAPGTDAKALLERVIAERGLRAALTSLDQQEGRARVLFNNVRFEALASMLDAVSRSDGLRLVDATLTTRVEPGTVRAELTFVRD